MTAPPDGQLVTGTLQLEAWHQRALPPVERLAPDLWSIPVPIPNSPLRYTSAYAFGCGERLVLVDSGWGSEESWQALCSGLRSIGAEPSHVSGVLVTHMHFDHVGLAGRLREHSGAWIAMHPADHAVLARPDERDIEAIVIQRVTMLRSFGASPAEAAEAVGPPQRYAAVAAAALPDRHLSDGDLADVPGWRLRALHTPGHTPGHLCFVDEDSRRFFAGDHVLPRVTPNISVRSADGDGSLHDYLCSLAKVRDLDLAEVLPAHEWRFRGLTGRADEIAAHHEKRLDELLAAIIHEPDSTPWHLASRLTWSRPWDQYGGRLRVMAVTETVAHVNELLRRGTISASADAIPTYRAA
jgi:glyoxylase-like metal-dependent hydrolase (beta-lactamase superfamily II)